MDPLSITCAALALVTAIKKTCEVLKVLHGAFKEVQQIQELVEESSEAGVVLHQVETLLQGYTTSTNGFNLTDTAAALTPIVDRLRLCLSSIDTTTKALAAERAYTSPSRWRSTRSALAELPRLKAKLHSSRINVSIALSTILANHAQGLDSRAVALLQHLDNAFQYQLAFQSSALRLLDDHAHTIQHLDTRLDHFMRDFSFTGRPMLDIADEGEGGSHAGLAIPDSASSTSDQLLLTDTSVAASSSSAGEIALRASKLSITRSRGRWSCSSFCPCSCHAATTITTGEKSRQAFGFAALSFITPEALRGPCSETRCRKRSSPMLHMEYTFPPWLLMAWVSATIKVKLQKVEISCATSRLRPDSAPVFRFAIEGDLGAIRKLFDAGEASPYDVDASTRTSLLVYATDRGHIDLWRFLLEAGADPYLETSLQHSPMDVACGRILGQTASQEVIAALSEDFDVQEYLVQRRFPTLQGIVLGYVDHVNIDDYLSVSTTGINEVDYQGRTALSWAAIRGDVATLKTLLKHGADPNVLAFNLDAPLHYATRACNPECIQPLIDHGADINALNAWRVNPLCYATTFRDDVRFARPLVEAGADLNLCDKHGRSAMVRAVHNNRPRLCRYLLEHGAHWIDKDVWGHSTLEVSLENGTTEVTAVLLHHRLPFMSPHDMASLYSLAVDRGDRNAANLLQAKLAKIGPTPGVPGRVSEVEVEDEDEEENHDHDDHDHDHDNNKDDARLDLDLDVDEIFFEASESPESHEVPEGHEGPVQAQ